jgi:hypothetical protein
MGGDEFKQTRRFLMENLGGHTAFRTPEEAEKAKIKSQKKRDALKAAKAAVQAASNAEGLESSEETSESPASGNMAEAASDAQGQS